MMNLPFAFPVTGMTAVAVMAGLYLLSLLLTALTSPPPPKSHSDSPNSSSAEWQFDCK
jgi:hypothetical protein